MKRILSALLLAVMLAASLAACGESASNEPSAVTGQDASAAAETTAETVTTVTPSGVPDGVSFDGETISIWYTVNAVSVAETFIDLEGELNGELLSDAIYNANAAVEEKLGVDLVFYSATDVTTSDTGAAFQKLMLANDTTYDLFNLVQWNSLTYITDGFYLNMADADYISYDQPWWDLNYMKEMVLGNDRIYGLVGDCVVDRTRCLSGFYYNKNLYESYYGDGSALYNEVIDGKWTFDMLRSICAEVYADLDNDGAIGWDDRIGMVLNDYNNADVLFSGARGVITERDEDGYPVLILNGERNVSVLDGIYDIYYNTVGVFNTGHAAYEDDVKGRNIFERGDAMFFPGFFYTAEAMRDMTDDYGVIPAPKYNEEQDQYASDVHDIIRIMAVPYNCLKVEAVSAVLEELSWQGYNNELPAYYDVLMKNKYARDDVSAEMIDIIRDNCFADIAHIVNKFNGLGYAARNMVQAKNNFSSYYASKETAAIAEMEKFIALYEALDH